MTYDDMENGVLPLYVMREKHSEGGETYMVALGPDGVTSDGKWALVPCSASGEMLDVMCEQNIDADMEDNIWAAGVAQAPTPWNPAHGWHRLDTKGECATEAAAEVISLLDELRAECPVGHTLELVERIRAHALLAFRASGIKMETDGGENATNGH